MTFRPIAQFKPGGSLIDAEGLPGLRVSPGVKREPAIGVSGDMLAFGPGGRIDWESDALLGDSGSILLDFAYKADSYQVDQPVLRVAQPDGTLVLAVTLGRIMFKVSRPPHEFVIDLYLNEREESWMRTVLTWERLDADRLYLRVSVNGRPYDRAIVPSFPEGKLLFTVAPETGRVREAAFYDRPLPPALHPHVNRLPAAVPAEEALRRQGFISDADQAALDARGGVAVFVPDGLRTGSLLSGLRLMGLDFQVVDARRLKEALRRAAVLILPDADWPDSPLLAGQGDRILTDLAGYVRQGGGLFALGEGAEVARRAGLIEFESHPAPMEGRTGFRFLPASPVVQMISDDWARAPFELNMVCRNGPHYRIPDSRAGEVVAVSPFTRLPCALASRAGEGRVVLSAVLPFGPFFGHPVFELAASVAVNAKPYMVFKAMLFHAAGIPLNGSELGTIPREPRGMASLGKEAANRGTVAFWLKADTEGLRDARPRNLFLMKAGEATAQLCYEPRDQVLVFEVVTANGESVTVVREGLAWDGRDWRHIGVTWEPTATGEAAVGIRIDGRLAATGGMPLPGAAWGNLRVGDVEGMRGLEMALRAAVEISGAEPDWAAIRAEAAPPRSFEDEAAELARLATFQRATKLALLAETLPRAFVRGSVYELYGLRFDVLFEKDLLAGALQTGGYTVLYAPGGGLPEVANGMAMQEAIRSFVRAGGGYVGICAGMNEASSNWPPDKSANLFQTPLVHLGGIDLLEVRLTGDHPVLRGVAPACFAPAPAVRFMHMSGSPLKLDAPASDVQSVAPLGLAPEFGAAGSFVYGKGRGVVWCTHPECGAGWGWWVPSDRTRQVIRRLFRNSVFFAAGDLV